MCWVISSCSFFRSLFFVSFYSSIERDRLIGHSFFFSFSKRNIAHRSLESIFGHFSNRSGSRRLNDIVSFVDCIFVFSSIRLFRSLSSRHIAYHVQRDEKFIFTKHKYRSYRYAGRDRSYDSRLIERRSPRT